MKYFKKNDIIIFVMGARETEKDTFINMLANGNATSVNYHTSIMEHLIVQYPRDTTRRVVIIDTPSFHDTDLEGLEISKCISTWVARIKKDKTKLAGVVCLHEMSQSHVVSRHIDVLKKICREETTMNAVLATIKQDHVGHDLHEQELADKWKRGLGLGSVICQLERSSESAWEVVDLLINSQRGQIHGFRHQERGAKYDWTNSLKRSMETEKNMQEGGLRKEHGWTLNGMFRGIFDSWRRDVRRTKSNSEMHIPSIVSTPMARDDSLDTDYRGPPEAGGKRRTWNGRDRKPDDTLMEDVTKNDVVVLIMGPTGVGKSTFINIVSERPIMSVGHDLASHTSTIQYITLPHPSDPNRRLILVDTPGFNDTFVADEEILRRIAVWLAQSYSDEMKLAGIIYLHDISVNRMYGILLKHFTMFTKLCGNRALKNAIIATTRWEGIEDAGKDREKQLAEKYWKDMLDLGAQMYRLSRTAESEVESAKKAVEIVLANIDRLDAVDHVQIQTEMVERNTVLADTEAGRAIREG